MYKKISLTILSVVIILLGVTGVVSLLWQTKINPESTTNNSVKLPPKPDVENGLSGIKLPPPPMIPEPAIVNDYSGRIIKLFNDSLVISTRYGEKTVKLSGSTLIEKIFMNRFPKLPPIPGQPASQQDRPELPEPEIISLEDLNTGQEIQVHATENIRGQEEFWVEKISLLIKL